MLSFKFGAGSWARIALSAVVATVIVAVVAPVGQASFTDTSICSGSAINGEGSSLQATAQQQLWTVQTFAEFCGTVGATAPTVTYTSSSSGKGRGAMGSIDGNRTSATNNLHNSRFAGTDDPPTPTEQANMNNGTSPGPEDNALIHVVPVASAAITVDVNVPAACVTHIPAALQDATTGQLKLPNSTLVGVFNGTITTWGTVLGGSGDATCDAVLVRRVVRSDNSGSTFVLKTFLNHAKAPADPTFDTTNNTTWPNTTGIEDDSGTCVDPVKVFCKPASTGGGALGTELSATPGGFGYMDLATARGKGFDFSGSLATDTTMWVEIQTTGSSPTTYDQPTADVNGWKSAAASGGAGPKGANCLTTTYRNIPTTGAGGSTDPTTGDWSTVDGTAPATNQYPVCTLTWDLAYDDDAAAYGNTPTEEKMARTVKDYLTAVVGNIGQLQLSSYDYAPLPASVDALSVAGVTAIGWNKSADNSGGGPTTTTVTQPPPTTTATSTQPPPPPPPSNKFTIASSHVSGHKLVLSLQLPGGGKLSVKATATYKGKSLTVGTSANTVGGGKGSITLNASSKTIADLKKVTSLKVKVTITFTPTGGTAVSHSVTLTLKGSFKPPKKHKKHH
jgi:hypothetical protein